MNDNLHTDESMETPVELLNRLEAINRLIATIRCSGYDLDELESYYERRHALRLRILDMMNGKGN